MTIPLFDTHAHLIGDDWKKYPPKPFTEDLPVPERPPYTVTAEHLLDLMDEHDVEHACLVQRGHVYGYDNSYILDSGCKYSERLHPVVILDTQDAQTASAYREMVTKSGVVGFRMANSRPWILDTAWLSSPTAIGIWEACADLGTPMTLIVFDNQLSYVLPLIKMLARMFPELPIILDHGAMPYGISQYEVALREEKGETVIMPPPPDYGISDTIATFDDVTNIYFKITEINMERVVKAGVNAAELLRTLVDRFGSSRVMWGSDVGQSHLWNYTEKVAMAKDATGLLTDAETRAFLHDNAFAIYEKAMSRKLGSAVSRFKRAAE
ncbi:amidohydrolase family protein [Aurantiacibacter poecillastricola]|uniref:amidohydrolase family protein n=1 Tax=Aurantiacibacter poecillastricola TaxID=3064385 RepID=UPI00273DC648|nr:amidohydrolase family protein [Aurantiacibacter sp. 219JJ12-13]MDP5263251.1 amidohydrolase family protein [Aurantiacibacter sp. 219JJ12-13]